MGGVEDKRGWGAQQLDPADEELGEGFAAELGSGGRSVSISAATERGWRG